jgi:hypothetical protein
MIHYLPTMRSEQEGFDKLAELAADAHDPYNGRLELSFSRCGFFDAIMAAPLFNFLWIQTRLKQPRGHNAGLRFSPPYRPGTPLCLIPLGKAMIGRGERSIRN